MSAALRRIRARSWYGVSAHAGWAAFAAAAAWATASGVEPRTVAIRRPVAGSRLNEAILKILQQEGYITKYEVLEPTEGQVGKTLSITLASNERSLTTATGLSSAPADERRARLPRHHRPRQPAHGALGGSRHLGHGLLLVAEAEVHQAPPVAAGRSTPGAGRNMGRVSASSTATSPATTGTPLCTHLNQLCAAPARASA